MDKRQLITNHPEVNSCDKLLCKIYTEGNLDRFEKEDTRNYFFKICIEVMLPTKFTAFVWRIYSGNTQIRIDDISMC